MGNRTYTEVISAIEKYDPGLKEHCQRTAALAKRVAILLKRPASEVDNLYTAAMVHDIGKIFLDPEILMSPRKLTQDERRAVDMHSLMGCIYLESVGAPADITELVLLHHGYNKERYGRTYSSKNCLSANILRACDIFDAVTHDRPYHKKVTVSEGLQIVQMQNDLTSDILKALARTDSLCMC